MAAVSTSPVVGALSSGGSSMAAEAQRLMALSVNKIITSRSRRGGISLHRNLLVAGVLFRARDALLAAGKMPSLSSSSSPSSSSSGSPSAPEKQRHRSDQATEDNSCNSSSSSASSSTEAAAMPQSQSQSDAHSESAASEAETSQGQVSAANADDDAMDVDVVGKENVPPPTPAVVQPTVTAEFSKPAAETDEAKECGGGLKQCAVAAARKRRCSETLTSPVVKKSVKTCSSPSSTATSSAADSRTRSSSVPSCASRASPKRVTVSPKSSTTSGGSTTVTAVSPVVYLNQVDVAFCSTPGIGGGIMGSLRPVLVVQVV